jgi:hypothetical protein
LFKKVKKLKRTPAITRGKSKGCKTKKQKKKEVKEEQKVNCGFPPGWKQEHFQSSNATMKRKSIPAALTVMAYNKPYYAPRFVSFGGVVVASYIVDEKRRMTRKTYGSTGGKTLMQSLRD